MIIERAYELGRPVLILGATGTGKTKLAKLLHARSSIAEHGFFNCNLASLRPELAESELYGHVKGAFTGADKDRKGAFEMAGKGTLFLDEIGDLGPEGQKKLLRIFDDGTYVPLGSGKESRFVGRIIMATHRDLEAMVAKGLFRDDLYFRIQSYSIKLPGLAEDQRLLELEIQSVFDEKKRELGKEGLKLSASAHQALAKHSWPGNYRELAACLEYAVLCAEGEAVNLKELPQLTRSTGAGGYGPFKDLRIAYNYTEDMENIEKMYLEHLLRSNQGRINSTALKYNVCKATLLNKIKKYRINTWKFRAANIEDPE